jgi:signal transduction histidine kinase
MEKLSLEKADIDRDLKEELAVCRALKPYIGHCLTLNHDINNPLAGIIGYGEVLMEESGQLDEKQKGYLRQVLECAERIKKLVEDLCEEKIALAEGVDLKSVTEAYKNIAKPLD